VRPAWELGPLVGHRVPDARGTVAVLAYRGVTSKEIELPARRFAERLHANVSLVGARLGPTVGVEPAREVIVDATPATSPVPDVLLIPGGLGWRQVADDVALMTWVARAADSARAVLTVSTGSLLLAAAGRLHGELAAGHWLAATELAALGADVSADRVAHADDGRIVTASGVGAALAMVDELADRSAWAR
jgi:transcriptional regulator GlxA family with amidase domain